MTTGGQEPDPAAHPRLVLVAGSTDTGAIEGISAAGAAPELMAQTPSADAEVLAFGRPVRAERVPVSPAGCPTPALITRAAREALGFRVATVDAGLAAPTAAPTIEVGASPGRDIRESSAVPDAAAIYRHAQSIANEFPDEAIVIGETIPGGTTTAMGVLTALGEPAVVSSSLPENPLQRKRAVVEAGLAASGLDAGDCAGRPIRALEAVGDPVLAAVAGLVTGLAASDTEVTLAGGTQQLAAAALARHAGFDEPVTVATTTYVAEDGTAAVGELAAAVDADLAVTDPGFADPDHPAANRFEAGEGKEGVGMGGALALADSEGKLDDVRARLWRLYDRLIETSRSEQHGSR